VPKGCAEGFCHFCHLLTFGVLRKLPGKGAEGRVIQHKRETLVGNPQGAGRKGPMKERKGGRALCSPLGMKPLNS